MLTDIIPAQYRKTVYAIYGIGAVLLGVWQIIGLYPDVRETAAAVWLYLGVAVGAVAASNTPAYTAQHAVEEQ